MGKALTATTISPHEFCSNTTPKGGAITDCTTLVLALFTSNDAAAMLSGGSSSTSTSRTIAVLVSAATCFASSSADSAASPEETPPTSLSSAESVSSASLLDTREPRSACARRTRGGDRLPTVPASTDAPTRAYPECYSLGENVGGDSESAPPFCQIRKPPKTLNFSRGSCRSTTCMRPSARPAAPKIAGMDATLVGYAFQASEAQTDTCALRRGDDWGMRILTNNFCPTGTSVRRNSSLAAAAFSQTCDW